MNEPERMPPIVVSDELLGPTLPDVLRLILRKQHYAMIKKERAELAAVTNDELAWTAYPPTPDDDPAEYKPYWMRLKDVPGVTQEQLEDATAALIEQMKP